MDQVRATMGRPLLWPAHFCLAPITQRRTDRSCYVEACLFFLREAAAHVVDVGEEVDSERGRHLIDHFSKMGVMRTSDDSPRRKSHRIQSVPLADTAEKTIVLSVDYCYDSK